MNETNEIFDLATELVLYTRRHLFLTGKAGTGKTTFLRKIQAETTKKTAVIAPTGVAAINAGGVTMHSFFQLPFEPFVPARGFAPENTPVANRNNLFKKIRLSAVKREVMEELELLIIDEVSMLRADQLDCIDTILQGVRKNLKPFGGVQLLLIGDMFQLPPVVNQNDTAILHEYYDSPFFFEAHVLKNTDLLRIELEKVYRQKEQRFIELLNHVRNNQVNADDLNLLHSRFQPDFHPDTSDGFITITSHNYKADERNARELQKLPGKSASFKGNLTGEFNEKNLPTELELVLKEGAQVMFVKNDVGENRRFYNGKLAFVKSVQEGEILVEMKDDGVELLLEKEEWKNVRYTFNKEKDSMEEEELGSFRQYPIRLAWAITIHKSQGLTFDKVCIDAGQSFAAGQVYVALSRCTTLEGMVLLSRIRQGTISIDEKISDFTAKHSQANELNQILGQEKRAYLTERMIHAFELERIIRELQEFPRLIMEKDLPDKAVAYEMSQQILASAIETETIISRFRDQLKDMLSPSTPSEDQLQERVSKAVHWLAAQYGKKILQPLADHLTVMTTKKRVKGYLKEIRNLYGFLLSFLHHMYTLEYNGRKFLMEGTLDAYFPLTEEKLKPSRKTKGKRAPKGETYRITLEMFKNGKSPELIATERSLAPTTIESHLAYLIGEGEILVTDVVAEEKFRVIREVIQSHPAAALIDLKRILSDEISFGEIKAVQSHLSLSDK